MGTGLVFLNKDLLPSTRHVYVRSINHLRLPTTSNYNKNIARILQNFYVLQIFSLFPHSEYLTVSRLSCDRGQHIIIDAFGEASHISHKNYPMPMRIGSCYTHTVSVASTFTGNMILKKTSCKRERKGVCSMYRGTTSHNSI